VCPDCGRGCIGKSNEGKQWYLYILSASVAVVYPNYSRGVIYSSIKQQIADMAVNGSDLTGRGTEDWPHDSTGVN